ncbi:MAG: aspartate kinase [Firmicutes bacterium]|nr:aspartate kinase [Bacillota bacterium]
MGIKVAKFGGSSVADGIQLAKMKEIVNADEDRKYVIVSAPGKRFNGDNKITDLLYMCKAQKDQNIPADQLFQVIADRFNALVMSLGLDVDLTGELDTIRKNLDEGCTADYIASRGEYLSAIVTAAYLGYDFVDTANLILFDKKGRLMADETNEALAAELAKHERAVIPGFYGSSAETGEIKVFSRGGSDITGSLVAKAVKADMYENWTDVSGFLMTDPRIVDNPKPIERISYIELRELAYMGANVLHEDAIYPVRNAGVPINIRNTNKPEDPGTIITAEMEPSDKIVSGIAGHKDFTVIAIYKHTLNSEVGIIRKLLSVLEDNNISFEHMPSGIDTVSLVISNDELDGKLDDLIEQIEMRMKPDSIEVHDDIALLAVVGAGMDRKPGTSARIFTALAENNVNIRMIDQGSSEINIIIGVANDDFETAIRAIYKAFE